MVVVASEADYDLRLLQAVEDLWLQGLVPQLAVTPPQPVANDMEDAADDPLVV
jgi:hypothetical protein